MTLFKLPNPETASPEVKEKLIEYAQIAPNAPTCAPDPYGNLPEAWFTLFRILTGEDWTDLRYNLQIASEMKLINASPIIVSVYHVMWFILAAFLLLNLLVGAILNNYQVIMEEQRQRKLQEQNPTANE